MPVKKKLPIADLLYDKNASISYLKNIYRSEITTMHEKKYWKVCPKTLKICIWKKNLYSGTITC